MRYFYAQIDATGICIALSDISGEVIAANMIPLAVYDSTVIGKRWTGSAWVAVP